MPPSSPQAFQLLGRSVLPWERALPEEPGGLGQMETVSHEEWDIVFMTRKTEYGFTWERWGEKKDSVRAGESWQGHCGAQVAL